MAKSSPTKKSKGKPPFKSPNQPAGGRARAHREDTGEAAEQRRRAPKTHPPGRTPGAVRKDKPRGRTAPR